MMRAHALIARGVLLVVAFLIVACHKTGAQKKSAGVDRVVQDSVRMALFKDTVGSAFAPPGAREYDLRRAGQRDSLRATLKRERALWRAKRPPAYRFFLRVSCFCPGQRGWLLIEVRNGQPLRAWDKTGKPAVLDDWSTFNIDQLFDKLQRSVDRPSRVAITFESRWHFPSHVSTVVLPGPDMWGNTEVRAFRPM